MKYHPEQLSGEVFIGNCTNSLWKTARKGNVAYSPVDGRTVLTNTRLKPTFVQASEIREALLQTNIDRFCRRVWSEILNHTKP